MGQAEIKNESQSPYAGCCVVLTTKHHKSVALAPPFETILGAGMLEYVVDTDQLGTFSGEIKRKGSALETARKKCGGKLFNAHLKLRLVIAKQITGINLVFDIFEIGTHAVRDNDIGFFFESV